MDVESFLQGCAPVVPDTTGETDEESGGAVETDEESGAAAPAISILAFVAWTLLIV